MLTQPFVIVYLPPHESTKGASTKVLYYVLDLSLLQDSLAAPSDICSKVKYLYFKGNTSFRELKEALSKLKAVRKIFIVGNSAFHYFHIFLMELDNFCSSIYFDWKFYLVVGTFQF